MRVLGIETATDMSSVAIADESGLTAEFTMCRGAGHAESLPLSVKTLFDRTGLAMDSLSGLAVSIGPGSFTGLRIGLGLAKGMALSLGLPLAAVPTLDALAARIPPAPWAAIVIPSQRNEVYLGLYRFGSNGWSLSDPVRFIPTDRVFEELPQGGGIMAGPNADAFRDGLHRADVIIHRLLPSALTIAEAGIRKFQKGETSDLDSTVPFYLKRFQGVA
jgi:tRNA threonylcarbamoyladenosine biosynthesis protein TsaB